MVPEELVDRRVRCRAPLFFQLFEKHSHLTRIVTSVVHDVGAQQIGLRLSPSRVLQEVRTNTKRDAQLSSLGPGAVAHQATQDREGKLRSHLLGDRPRY